MLFVREYMVNFFTRVGNFVDMFKRLFSGSHYRRWAFVIIALAVLLRLVLIFFNWPYTDSDEGNMGVLAMHVAFQGDHPTFFYGAPYLGPLEGYAAAPLFRLFGISLFNLRLPLVMFFAAFLVSMYYLAFLLFADERFALFTIILLSLGSPDVLFLQLRASGEYPELEMFAALICLLATWLALTYRQPKQNVWKRIGIYGLLGLFIGLAVWVDVLILPFVAATGLLLLFFCFRELLRWQGLSYLLGVIVGVFPVIYYNLTVPWSQNSWYVFLYTSRVGSIEYLARHLTPVHNLSGTLLVALPMATGGSLHCPLTSIPPFGTPTSETLLCVAFQAGWSIGYLLLWLVGVGLAIYIIGRYVYLRSKSHTRAIASQSSRQEAIRQVSRLGILGSVGLTLLLYGRAPTSATSPDTTFRYLTLLLIAVPVLLWPLWKGMSLHNFFAGWKTRICLLVRGAALLLVLGTFASATIRTSLELPATQAQYESQQALVQDLLHVGATRVYSDYWTCNILTFLSKEKIICSALDDHLNPGYDRYMPFRALVRAAPHPTYIFPQGAPQLKAMQQRVNANSSGYRQYLFEGYFVYQTT
jgi:4-amino-4-deoxy-L-arabinose transferase-like glycosyltransferase